MYISLLKLFQVVRTRKRPSTRLPYKSPKQQKLEMAEAAEALLIMNEAEKPTEESEVPSTSGTQSAIQRTASIGVLCKPHTEEKDSQTEKAASSDVVRLQIENRILENNLKVSTSDSKLLNRPLNNLTLEAH